MSDVKKDPTLLGLEHEGLEFQVLIDDGLPVLRAVRKGMGEDVPRPQVVEEQGFDGVGWLMFAEIHHHRHIGEAAGGNRPVNLLEPSPVVGRLNADEDLGIESGDHVRRLLGVHIIRVLLIETTGHPISYDVQQGQDPGLGAVDRLLFELRKVPPAG